MIYVAHGLAGYGPDLDETDEGFETYTDAAVVIHNELLEDSEQAEESARLYAESEDYKAAWKAHVLSEDLLNLARNFDPERASAPLHSGKPDLWENTLRTLVSETFPLDVAEHSRLYVWEAEDS
jgi:hypothetical protein